MHGAWPLTSMHGVCVLFWHRRSEDVNDVVNEEGAGRQSEMRYRTWEQNDNWILQSSLS